MSISLDFTLMFAQVGPLVNSLWPVFVIPLGIGFAFAVLNYIVNQVKGVKLGGGK